MIEERTIKDYSWIESEIPCIKKNIRSIEEAVKIISNINSKRRTQYKLELRKYRETKKGKPKKLKYTHAYYWCGKCKAYHITSHAKPYKLNNKGKLIP